MKSLFFFSVVFLLVVAHSTAQSCKQVVINDSIQKKVISEYINESIKQRYFFQDKGVVVITRFTDQNGSKSWSIRTTIDDGYKDNPPIEWASFGQDIILIYDARSRFDVVKNEATPQLINCLNEAIGDRLYMRPTKVERSVDVLGVDGKMHKRNTRRAFGGNTSNEKIVHFEKDGIVRILQSI